MRFVLWKRWVWVIVGVGFGLGMAYFYGEYSVPASARRISVGDFEESLGDHRLTHVTVFPASNGIYLVTGLLSIDGENGPTTGRRYLLAKTPFETSDGKFENVVAYLNKMEAGDWKIRHDYAWWKEARWKYLAFVAGMVLIVGGAWPTVLRMLIKAGYGPKGMDEESYDLSRFGRGETAKTTTGPAKVTREDRARLDEMNEALASGLGASTTAASSVSGAAPGAAEIQKLTGGRLEQMAKEEEEEREYRGEFYPTAKGNKPKGHAFSLVELLVVIGIIGLLIAILMPVLSKARRSAMTIQCAGNLRSIGQGMAMYLVENHDTYPPAYLYVGHTIVDGVQSPPGFDQGYVHWSSYLYGSGKTPAKAFECPAMNRGGLPPTNTTEDNLDPGQVVQESGVVDKQAPRLAYTVNEAICPRNKFVQGFQGASRIYKFVKAGQVGNASGTILGTEWVDMGLLIGRDTGSSYVMSHRPVHGFIGSDGTLDMFVLSPDTGYRRATANDLDPDPETEVSTNTRLDWVGRNHGQKRGYPDKRLTNFLYVDGHVVSKSIYETFTPFEWGERFYSLEPAGDLVGP